MPNEYTPCIVGVPEKVIVEPEVLIAMPEGSALEPMSMLTAKGATPPTIAMLEEYAVMMLPSGSMPDILGAGMSTAADTTRSQMSAQHGTTEQHRDEQ